MGRKPRSIAIHPAVTRHHTPPSPTIPPPPHRCLPLPHPQPHAAVTHHPTAATPPSPAATSAATQHRHTRRHTRSHAAPPHPQPRSTATPAVTNRRRSPSPATTPRILHHTTTPAVTSRRRSASPATTPRIVDDLARFLSVLLLAPFSAAIPLGVVKDHLLPCLATDTYSICKLAVVHPHLHSILSRPAYWAGKSIYVNHEDINQSYISSRGRRVPFAITPSTTARLLCRSS